MTLPGLVLAVMVGGCVSPDGGPHESCGDDVRPLINQAAEQVDQGVPDLSRPERMDGCAGGDGYFVQLRVHDVKAAGESLRGLGCTPARSDGPGPVWQCTVKSTKYVVTFGDLEGRAELTLA